MAPLMHDDDDFIGTLSDNDSIPDEAEAEIQPPSTNGAEKRKRDTKKQQTAVKKQKRDDVEGEENGETQKDSDLDSEFEFGLEDGTAALDDYEALIGDRVPNAKKAVDVGSVIARRGHLQESNEDEGKDEGVEGLDGDSGDRVDGDGESEASFDGFGGGADLAEDEEGHGSDGGNDSPISGSAGEEEDEDAAIPVPHPDDMPSDSASDRENDAVEDEKQKAFFAPAAAPSSTIDSTFLAMSLSRPILKGLAELRFTTPTPIQAKTIPVGLAGKDVVGGAVTGSGKTAAFLIPILERLMFRPKRTATIRVAILTPTRELALQCYQVAKKLAQFTDITFGQAIGGLNMREQEKQLKQRPDIVIGTPGRFIDLERNTAALAVNTVEILVLDEADRMLEEGFADELNEILTKIPKSRQTMLFSATMTSKVDDLVRAGLQRPVRIVVDASKSTVAGLVQEFVRLRPGREGKRLGYLLHLCTEVHTERVIVFFRQKKDAHRNRVLFALCGLKAAELHGSMTQEQRLQAIEAFRSGRASFLLATDLASRGLDIKGIETVINFEAPQSHEIYLHRVGRTARAGRSGRACTIAAEPDRKVVKAAVKSAKQQGAQIRQRTIPPEEAEAWQTKIDGLQDEIESILQEEKEERAMQTTERDLHKADNMVAHEQEILSRPKKTWFESEKDKKAAKTKGGEVLNGPGGVKKEKKGKLSNKQKKKLQDRDERRDVRTWKKGKGKGK